MQTFQVYPPFGRRSFSYVRFYSVCLLEKTDNVGFNLGNGLSSERNHEKFYVTKYNYFMHCIHLWENVATVEYLHTSFKIMLKLWFFTVTNMGRLIVTEIKKKDSLPFNMREIVSAKWKFYFCTLLPGFLCEIEKSIKPCQRLGAGVQ